MDLKQIAVIINCISFEVHGKKFSWIDKLWDWEIKFMKIYYSQSFFLCYGVSFLPSYIVEQVNQSIQSCTSECIILLLF